MVNKKAGAGMSVAEFIAAQIAMSDKTQREIALALGYDKPNIITMFKQGLTKIPLNKVAPLARVGGKLFRHDVGVNVDAVGGHGRSKWTARIALTA